MKIIRSICPLLILLFILPVMVSAAINPIAEKIKSELNAAPNIGPHDVNIRVNRDVAELIGDVYSPADSKAIENIAKQTKGIKSVDNRLHINPALKVTGPKAQNLRLEYAVRDELIKTYEPNRYAYHVSARGDSVNVVGKFASSKDLANVESIVRTVPGVKNVRVSRE